MRNIDDRIGYALGVGREIDDQTRIAGLVELVKEVHGLYEKALSRFDETFAELEGETQGARDQNLKDLREAQGNVTNLIEIAKLIAALRLAAASLDEEE